MSWDEALLKIAQKHKIGILSSLSTDQIEDRIKNEIGAARFQKYRINYKYKGDVGIK